MKCVRAALVGAALASTVACSPAAAPVPRTPAELAALRPFEAVPRGEPTPTNPVWIAHPLIYVRGLYGMGLEDARTLLWPIAEALERCLDRRSTRLDAVLLVGADGTHAFTHEPTTAGRCVVRVLESVAATAGSAEYGVLLTLADQSFPPPPSLSRAAINRTVNRAIGRIQRCYERELSAHPTLSGRVVVAWTIEADGRVANAVVVENGLNDAAANCIAQVIAALRFPVPRGEPVTVNAYPFLFQMIR